MSNKDPNFSHQTIDSTGQKAPAHMIGEIFHHRGNGHLYEIIGVCWIGDGDEWGFIHRRQGCEVDCVRSYNNFFGHMSDGRKRFHQVS